mmetsp:Transcript_7102/g.14361  ORF Transcript_7102/g.14361 Transcript_7102/m.14361 type:complete len:267 (-) Transcript_7102:2973-3773(-)
MLLSQHTAIINTAHRLFIHAMHRLAALVRACALHAGHQRRRDTTRRSFLLLRIPLSAVSVVLPACPQSPASTSTLPVWRGPRGSRSQDLRAGLHDVHLALRVHRALHVLGNPAERRLHRRPGRGELGHGVSDERLVPQQRLLAVVHHRLVRLLPNEHAVVEAGAREPLQVLRVGVGARDEGPRAGGVQGGVLRRLRHNLDIGAVLGAGEGEGAAGGPRHERLAEAHHHLAQHLLSVAAQGVGRVQHEGVLRRHHLLQQHGHAQLAL